MEIKRKYGRKITVKCFNCNKEFWTIPSRPSKFCSNKCYLKKGNKTQIKKGQHLSKKTEFKKGQTCGAKNINWKGGMLKSSQGYIFILCPYHPFANNHGYVPRSRLVMEKYLGRFLKPVEIVHHVNKIKADDRIENLMLFDNESKHHKYHWMFYISTSLKNLNPEEYKRRRRIYMKNYYQENKEKWTSKSDSHEHIG